MWDCCSQTLLKQAGEGPGWDLVVVLQECSQTPEAGAHKHKIKWLCPSKSDPVLSALKVGLKTPQEAGDGQAIPVTLPTAWGCLALVVSVRDGHGLENPVLPSWNEPPLRTFHKSCSSSGHTCKNTDGYSRVQPRGCSSGFLAKGPKTPKDLALCMGKQGSLVFLMCWFPISAVALLFRRLTCISHDEWLSQGVLNADVFILWQDGNVANLWAAGGHGLIWDLFLALAMRMVSLRAQQWSSLCCSRLRSPRVCQPGLWARAVLSCLQKW